MQAPRKLLRRKIANLGIALSAVLLAFGITGSPAPSAMPQDTETMSAYDLAQNYYNFLATQQAQPFVPSSLVRMPWFTKNFGVHTFGSQDKPWAQGGQSWPDDVPQWQILNRQYMHTLRRVKNQNLIRDVHSPLHNIDKAHRWGNAIFALGHELGHNLGNTYVEADADRWAKSHFKEYAAQLGLNRQQVRRLWRANDKFNWVQ